MRPVLVLAERDAAAGAVCRSTCALLTLARRLGAPAAVLDAPADPAAVALLGRFGADTVWTGAADGGYPAAARLDLLDRLTRRLNPAAVLLASNRVGREVAARLAVRLRAGLLGDIVDVRAEPGGPVAVQSVLGGAYVVESVVVRGTPVLVVRTEAVAPAAVPAGPAPAGPPVVRRLAGAAPRGRRVRRVARPEGLTEAAAAGPRDLATAAVVVAGGHGLGSRQAFGLVGQLADALGGAAGGSHTATELGWCPRGARIDQLGTIVHPRLYLALGISGSVRHRAAMQHAETIVAIDRDPAAPIFAIADLGVVGDVRRVVPELLAEIRRRRARPAIPDHEPPEDR
ncbi:electron transfer flavoprotein subunit alpha/FixB family protein [Dactylosporangium sp. CA-139066]|uniref:electron transfer flavoprotein subunit alpha/FixB family protein n=1 Tax=Dactylosporangium sp. CA-139066 TaxID=3239930 RepID=UPI003D8AA5C3